MIAVADRDPAQLKRVTDSWPHVEGTTDYRKLLNRDDIDAFVVATPTRTHFAIVKDCLEAGKHVLCEKPLTITEQESKALVELAALKQRVLMTGHIFLFNPGILKLAEMLALGEIGEVRYFYSKRTNLGPFRNDVNAAFDLASHDISIMNFLIGDVPVAVNAVGQSYLQADVEDVVFITLTYPNKIFAHIHVSWLDPKKVREITVVGSEKMATWNDLATLGPVTVFSKNVNTGHDLLDYGQFQLAVREGEIRIPYVKNEQPLRVQAEHFLDCILKNSECISDGISGLQVARVLSAIDVSLKNGGQLIPL